MASSLVLGTSRSRTLRSCSRSSPSANLSTLETSQRLLLPSREGPAATARGLWRPSWVGRMNFLEKEVQRKLKEKLIPFSPRLREGYSRKRTLVLPHRKAKKAHPLGETILERCSVTQKGSGSLKDSSPRSSAGSCYLQIGSRSRDPCWGLGCLLPLRLASLEFHHPRCSQWKSSWNRLEMTWNDLNSVKAALRGSKMRFESSSFGSPSAWTSCGCRGARRLPSFVSKGMAEKWTWVGLESDLSPFRSAQRALKDLKRSSKKDLFSGERRR